MSRITIRFARAADADRLAANGVVPSAPAASNPWPMRFATWLAEAHTGRRVVIVAEDAAGLVGLVQLIFAFPPGYRDDESANGRDTAMVESLRVAPQGPPQLLDKLLRDALAVAKQRGVRTVTLCLPLDDDRGVAQARAWGFTQFRLMPDGSRLLVLLRKEIA